MGVTRFYSVNYCLVMMVKMLYSIRQNVFHILYKSKELFISFLSMLAANLRIQCALKLI